MVNMGARMYAQIYCIYIETVVECPSFAFKSDQLRNHPLDRYAALGFSLCFRATVPLVKFRANRICSF